MKKGLLLICLMLISSTCFAFPTPNNYLVSAISAGSVTSNVATQQRARAVWIGTTQSLDFSFDGSTWVTFQGATAGTVIPLQAVGVRLTSGSANPAAGDVVFLY